MTAHNERKCIKASFKLQVSVPTFQSIIKKCDNVHTVKKHEGKRKKPKELHYVERRQEQFKNYHKVYLTELNDAMDKIYR